MKLDIYRELLKMTNENPKKRNYQICAKRFSSPLFLFEGIRLFNYVTSRSLR